MIVWLVETLSLCLLPVVFRRRPLPALTQKQRRGDPPLFLHQNIERTACRAELHCFEPDAARGERVADFRGGELLAHPGAEQHQLRLQRGERRQVRAGELGERGGAPLGQELARRDDAADMHALLADADLGLRVAADAVAARCGFKGELHDGGTIAPVREIVIVLTDLYHASGGRARLRMRRRARGCPASNTRAASVPARRLPAAGATGSPPPSGATIWWASRRRAIAAAVLPVEQGGTSWIATPVHLSAGLSQVHLDHRGLLRLGEAQRAALSPPASPPSSAPRA